VIDKDCGAQASDWDAGGRQVLCGISVAQRRRFSREIFDVSNFCGVVWERRDWPNQSQHLHLVDFKQTMSKCPMRASDYLVLILDI
jgi:hypothetical protein